MIAEPLDRVKRRFDLNIARAKSLIAAYDILRRLKAGNEPQRQDVLRSAVVFLHASLEDLLREIIRIKAPVENEKFHKSLMLEADGTIGTAKDKFSVSDLLKLQDKTVKQIIDQSIDNHLDRRSFNHIADIAAAVSLVGLSTVGLNKDFDKIEEAIKRRHKIVHQSDRASHNETSHGRPVQIDKGIVTGWVDGVEAFGAELLKRLREDTKPNSN